MTTKQHRLFDLDDSSMLDDSKIKKLIKKINNTVLSINETTGTNNIEAGQTYIGQMIAHDIVPSTNLFKNRMNISPALNLESIYGDDNDCAHFDKNGKFILGYSIDKDTEEKIQGNDLLRGEDGKALIPDDRNNENIIISQLHLLWQKLHNNIVDDLNNKYKTANIFTIAKNITISIFHEIVVFDYLKQILYPDIHELYFANKSKFYFYYGNKDKQFKRIPLEFAHGAFRFGHSMIRDRYDLNLNQDIKTVEMLKNRNTHLNTKFEIDWGGFFTVNRIFESFYHREMLVNLDLKYIKNANSDPIKPTRTSTTVNAAKIDTKIVPGMSEIKFLKCHEKDIREINLEAGLFKNKINNGNHIWLKLMEIDEFKNLLSNKLYKDKILHELPLWPYILQEAELNSNCCKHDGLGVIGSIIVAEVLKASINAANFKKNRQYKKAYGYIINRIKKIQYNKEIDYIPNSEKKKFLKKISKSPIKMGYIINYNNI